MNSKLHFFLVFCSIAILVGTVVGGPAVQDDDLVKRGEKHFIEVGCFQCHGYQGQGGAGPRLAPDPISLENFIRIVRRPPNVMPAYSPKVLSEEQLEQIYAYLESIPQDPDVSTIEILSEQ